jgi:hypothetical protein
MKGDSAMTAVKTAAAAVTALVVSSLFSAGTTSEPTFVFLRPETSSFWRTAFDSEITVPVDFPEGSDKATLRVSGLGYEREYADITAADLGENGFTFTLPQAVSPETENVYDLTLDFGNGVTRTAKIGVIQGVQDGAEGSTRCLAPSTSRAWSKVNGRAVMPLPYGTESFTVNGEPVAGLDGAQSWYAIGGLCGGASALLPAQSVLLPKLYRRHYRIFHRRTEHTRLRFLQLPLSSFSYPFCRLFSILCTLRQLPLKHLHPRP